MKNLTNLGRAFFAIAMGAFAIQYFVHALAASAPALGPPWTPTSPFGDGSPRSFWSPRRRVLRPEPWPVAPQYRWESCFLFVCYWLMSPRLAANIHDPGPWTSGSELLALCGAALVLTGVMKLGRILFAAPLLVFGVQHFLYARFIATLVPAWIPGRLFWAYFIGVAFFCCSSLSPLKQRPVCRRFCWASCFFCGCSSSICPE